MPKFFITGSFEKNDVLTIDGVNGHHISNVLRIKPGQKIILCDGLGMDYECIVQRMDGGCVTVSVLDKMKTPTEPSVFVTLFAAMPKGDKMETIIQKSVELGVYEIIPFFSERCVSRPDDRSLGKKTERYQKISEEAAKQCNRGIIPRVLKAISFSDMLKKSVLSDVAIMAYEEEREHSLKKILLEKGNFSTVSIVIGSEGGFAREEAEDARKSGLITASLGPRILRCETAPVAMLSAIMYHTGNI
ncbi:MAG: 16S rRNA (uracil(1498)-N(3))-methyltransferase [Clostridiales bacterium]|nr:16S rRNA (uracil(1498)-N(3))-methyltransferase [Clostridiales bacterium]